MDIFCKRKQDKGFTLIEVLLAISILGIMATTTMSFFSQAFDYTKRNESKTVGINVARNVLNYMEGQDFEKVKGLIESKTELTLTNAACVDPNIQNVLNECSNIFHTKINNLEYKATVTFPEVKEELLKENVINVNVKIEWPTNQSTSLQGVIKK